MNTWKTLQLLKDLLILLCIIIHYYSNWKIKTTWNLNILNMKNKKNKKLEKKHSIWWKWAKLCGFSFLFFFCCLILLVFHSESEVQNVWIFFICTESCDVCSIYRGSIRHFFRFSHVIRHFTYHSYCHFAVSYVKPIYMCLLVLFYSILVIKLANRLYFNINTCMRKSPNEIINLS